MDAALDVYSEVPIARENPLIGLPNAVVTSHIGTLTKESEEAGNLAAGDNLLAPVDGGIENRLVVVRPETLSTRWERGASYPELRSAAASGAPAAAR